MNYANKNGMMESKVSLFCWLLNTTFERRGGALGRFLFPSDDRGGFCDSLVHRQDFVPELCSLTEMGQH